MRSLQRSNSQWRPATDNSGDARLRSLPSVEKVLQHLETIGVLDGVPRPLAAACVRLVIDSARRRLQAGEAGQVWSPENILNESADAVARYAGPTLTRAVNATGILIHTNLGRAPLSTSAQQAVTEVLSGYSMLEIDPQTGERGARQTHVDLLLTLVTGAEAALAVNNNAAAVLLGLAALAAGGQVIVSRGELVEIGGGFRMPDVMAQSGARLVEVGTTNKTYPHDYERAITSETALLLKVHRSNFAMQGFVEEVSAAELVELGRRKNIRVMHDLGSGALVDLRIRGLPYEPTVQESVQAGCDLVTFSGDKLLGGPQAGVLVGHAEAIAICRRHPLARATRIDRLDLAALAATLRHYLRPDEPWREVPILRMLSADVKEVTDRALWVAHRLRDILHDRARVTVETVPAEVGGGALPGAVLSSCAVAVHPHDRSPEVWGAHLRRHRPPVIARVHEGALLLDMRTVLPEDLDVVLDAFR